MAADSIILAAAPMDKPPIAGLSELVAHLAELVDDAALPLNDKLLDDVQLQLTEDSIPPLLPTLLPPLTHILKSTTQDPTPLVSLSIKLLGPLSFAHTLAVADPPSLLTALRSPLPGANLLALAVLRKAAHAPSDAAILSTLPHVVEELVRRWLDSPDVGVGEAAARVLGDLLETDWDDVHGPELVKRRLPGHGQLWHLIFQSRPHLALIQGLCATGQPSRSMHAITTSQGRLLRLLPRLVTLDIRALSQTTFPDLFPLPDAIVQHTGRGLLQWAALGMVTDKSDLLMHLSLIDFFETLVSIMRVSPSRSTERDDIVKSLVREAVRDNADLDAALRTLPDRTAEEEAEELREYIAEILG